MLYGCETWCLGLNGIWILQRTKRVIVRYMCGVKFVDKKLSKDLMRMLDMNETIYQLARSNSVHWYGHVLRKYINNILRMTLYFKVNWKKKMGRPKKTWLKAVVELCRQVWLDKGDANNHSRWRLGVNSISGKMISI